MQVKAKGRLRVDDIRALFPYQEKPAISLPLVLTSAGAANTTSISRFVIDRLAGGSYAQRVWVPHNQAAASVAGGSGQIDCDGSLVNPACPTLTWDSIALGASCKIQGFSARPSGNQKLDVVWASEDEPVGATFDGLVNFVTSGAGNRAPQGLLVLLGRTVYHRVPVTGGSSTWEIQWVANLRLYSLQAGSNSGVILRVSQDGGTTWTTINADVHVGCNIGQVVGNALPGSAGGELPIQIHLMGRSMQVSVGAETSPVLVGSSDPAPTVAPTLTPGGGGSLAAGSYSVGYTYAVTAPDGTTEETALSPTASATVGASGSIATNTISLPVGATEIRWYVTAADGMRRTSVGASANITALPNSDAPKPPTASNLKPTIRKLRVLGSYFTQFSPEVHPYKYSVQGKLRPNPEALGFSPDPSTPPYFTISTVSTSVKRTSGSPFQVSFPAGSSVQCNLISSPTAVDQVYEVQIDNAVAGTWQGVQYADNTAFVARVSLEVDGRWQAVTTSNAQSIIPKSITFSEDLDLQALTVRRSLDVVVDNFHAQWAGQGENMGVTLALGLVAPAVDFVNQIAGFSDTWEYTRPSPAQAHMSFSVADQCQQLDEAMIAAPPLMDAWDRYYAMSFILQSGGVTKSQMAFASLIPSNPFTTAAGNPEPVFLPQGQGNAPWTPRNRTLSCLSLANFIRQSDGFLFYIDRNALFQYHRFIPPNPAVATKVFTEVATGADGANLSEFWNPRVRASNRNVRNKTVLIGIDPFGTDFRPILQVRTDQPSINAARGSRPSNFKGYRADQVMVSSLFATQTYASSSADRLHAIGRLPAYDVHYDCWMQPALQLMQVVNVQDSKSGAQTVPFYVVGMRHRWSILSGKQEIRTSVVGKFLI